MYIDRDMRPYTLVCMLGALNGLLCISYAGYRCNILDIRVHQSRLSAHTGSFVSIGGTAIRFAATNVKGTLCVCCARPLLKG